MPIDTLTCPKCSKVLKPARPVTPGKKVKCPKCETIFTAKEEAAPSAAAKKAKAAAKKPEDEEGGTYSFAQEDEEEQDEEDKPDLGFALDTSIKDPRGPAQALLVRPSNWLIRSGAIGFFSWLAILVILLIPVLFPLPEGTPDETAKRSWPYTYALGSGVGAATLDAPPPKELTKPKFEVKEEDKEPVPPTVILGGAFDMAKFGAARGFLFLLGLMPFIIGMLYAGLIIFGGVKMQTMESRAWGMAACILDIFPFNALGLIILTNILLNLLIFVPFGGLMFLVLCFIILAEIGGGVLVGVWGLLVLTDEKVKEGFEFVPE